MDEGRYVAWSETCSLQLLSNGWCEINEPIVGQLQSFLVRLKEKPCYWGIVSPFRTLARSYLTRLKKYIDVEPKPITVNLSRIASNEDLRASLTSVGFLESTEPQFSKFVTVSSTGDEGLRSFQSGESTCDWKAVTFKIGDLEASVDKDASLQVIRYPDEIREFTKHLVQLWQQVSTIGR
jgi:hypothetical protein